MATYKTPKPVPTPVVGADNIMETLRKTDVAVGNVHSQPYPGTKTDGIKIRGAGAATKGVMARGPMA